MTKAIRLLSRVLQLLQLRQLQQLRKGIALLAHVCLSMTKATRLLTRVLQLLQLAIAAIATIGCTFSAFQIYQ